MTVTNGAEYRESRANGDTMDDMPPTPAHARPAAKRDHLWVLVIIAVCCLIKVWPSWIGIGSEAGFPVIGGERGMPTDWTLAVVIEAYWGYAIYAALAAPAGRRSRRFAAWSAAGVFALSVAGQSAAEVAPATAVKVFANALPVTVLALIAVLVHYRQKDRDDAAEADERTAVQAEMDALRAQVKALASDLGAEQTARMSAQQGAAEALEQAGAIAQKLAAKSAQGKRAKTAQPARKSAQADDITLEFRALDELQKDPGLRAPRMGAELGRRIGASPATGRRLHAKLTAQGRPGESLTERSADQSGERSDERS